MLPLIAAVLITQTPAASRSADWQWQTVHFFGQSVWVFGVKGADGLVHYKQAEAGELIAPAEVERRKAEAEAKNVPPKSLNYGVAVEQMAADGRILRASDAETLAEVTAEVSSSKSCRDGPDDSGCRVGIVEKAEDFAGKAVAYGIAGLLILAAIFVFTRSPRPPT